MTQGNEQQVEVLTDGIIPEAAPSVVFKDQQGREWNCGINVATVKRVRERVSIDLMEVYAADSALLKRLMSDPVILCDVLFAVLEPQAKAAGVSDTQFAEALGGQVLDAAIDAFVAGLFAFPRHQEIRAALRKVYQAQRQLEDRAGKSLNRRLAGPEMAERIEATAKDLDSRLDHAMGKLRSPFGGRSTDAPASSASTPAPSPSGS